MEPRALLQTYPNTVHISAVAIASLFGLTTTPTFVPVVLTLAALLFYAPHLFPRPHAVGYTALLWLLISLCSTLGRLVPALNALSSAGPSIAVLLVMSSVASAVAIIAIFVDKRMDGHTRAPQAVLFPAIWTLLWVAASHLPFNLGRLTSWSPMSGIQAYQWMSPWTGPAGIDWVTAAWAVVVSQSLGKWYMGGGEESSDSRKPKAPTKTEGTSVLAIILIALTIPSFIISGHPLPVVSSDTVTSVSIGCVLPSTTSPSLGDYIKESQKVTAHADLILWPEGAVTFRDANDKENAIKKIQDAQASDRGKPWAVSFQETTIDPWDDKGRATISRMGVAVISSEDVSMTYYKRSLVPIAESFHLTPGRHSPSTFALPLKKGKRSVDVTASICLDFAMPSPFGDLDSKPGLILAPARTWDPAIGNRMWEEVKQRANEIGSLALWCDGGKGGVSGVAGGGYNDIYQVGAGSWVRTVGISHPFDSTGRTFYARYGDASVVVVSWVLAGGFWLALAQRKQARLRDVGNKFYDLVSGLKQSFLEWRQRRPGPAEQPNLIDF
ncbi:hypothetical protein C8R47DRAFT_1007331 [Mycena vitilis]|nr:hypothetical protein C8R47DRAFT_1007331 [Mycena vitilis]